MSSRTSGQHQERPNGEADFGWHITNAVVWQLQILECNSSTGTAAPYAEALVDSQSQLIKKPILRRPTNADQHAVAEQDLNQTSWYQ